MLAPAKQPGDDLFRLIGIEHIPVRIQLIAEYFFIGRRIQVSFPHRHTRTGKITKRRSGHFAAAIVSCKRYMPAL